LAGYSGTALAKKLGIKEDAAVFVVDAPVDYAELVAPLPRGVTLAPRMSSTIDVVHVFAVSRKRLESTLGKVLGKLKPAGAIWVSWPKKSSKVPTDITEDTIRKIALPLGLVDTKVCAVDDVWSGLKLVIRLENRR
jgi:hypothetical protein